MEQCFCRELRARMLGQSHEDLNTITPPTSSPAPFVARAGGDERRRGIGGGSGAVRASEVALSRRTMVGVACVPAFTVDDLPRRPLPPEQTDWVERRRQFGDAPDGRGSPRVRERLLAWRRGSVVALADERRPAASISA